MTTDQIASLTGLKQAQQALTMRLAHFRRRVRTRLVLEGSALFLAEIAGAALLTFLIDHTFRVGRPLRLALLVAALVFLGFEFVRRIIAPLRLRLGLVALAGAIDRKNPNAPHALAARVASVLELPRLLEGPNPPSHAMVERAVVRCEESLRAFNFESVLNARLLKRAVALIAAALLVPAVLILLFPANAGLWARRLFLASTEPWPQSTYLDVADVHDGRIAVPRGEPYVLRANARSGSITPDRVLLTMRSDGNKTSVVMKEFAKNDFRHDFAVVDQPLQLNLEGGDDELGPITLQPVDRPRISDLQLLSQHPRQPTPDHHSFNGGDADFSFLVKTKLVMNITANVPLREVRLKPQSPHPQPNNLHPIDSTHYTIEWTHDGPAKFDLELVSADSGLVSLPIPISIGLKIDQPPRVTMAYTGVHPRITPQARIPITIDARDDYGVIAASLNLKDELPDPNDPAKLVPHETSNPLFPPPTPTTQPDTQPAATGQPDLQLKQTIALAPLKLPAGALFSITALATDDCYTGRQTTHSRTVTFRLVPPEELFREILQRQQAERVKYRKQMEEAEKLRDLLRSPPTASAIADAARRQRALERETLRISSVLAESLTEMELNALGSPESHTLMRDKVLAPLGALQNELIAPQVQALDTLLPDDPARLQAAADREAQIAARMQIILQQMAQWDSFVDVLNQLDTIIKLETQVKDSSEKLQHKQSEDLFDK